MGSKYKRILLKLSGETLQNREKGLSIDPDITIRISRQVQAVLDLGVQIGIVIGGGNIFRGLQGSEEGIDRATGDYMGMLATIINALALQHALEDVGIQTRVQTAIEIPQVAETYIRRRAIRHLEKGRVVIFAAGTGNPYFTTDTAASLRAVEIGADVIFKATKVDGVYSADPMKDNSAVKFSQLSYLEILKKGLQVMDSTSVSLCMDNKLPMIIFNVREKNSIKKVLMGEKIGTLVGVNS